MEPYDLNQKIKALRASLDAAITLWNDARDERWYASDVNVLGSEHYDYEAETMKELLAELYRVSDELSALADDDLTRELGCIEHDGARLWHAERDEAIAEGWKTYRNRI